MKTPMRGPNCSVCAPTVPPTLARAGRATAVLALIALAFASTAVGFAQPATGDYLNNARVAVKGTNLVTLTDDSGAYRFTSVPAGPTTLRVFFTGLDEKEATVASRVARRPSRISSSPAARTPVVPTRAKPSCSTCLRWRAQG